MLILHLVGPEVYQFAMRARGTPHKVSVSTGKPDREDPSLKHPSLDLSTNEKEAMIKVRKRENTADKLNTRPVSTAVGESTTLAGFQELEIRPPFNR